jgi:STE24 endopeptidase
MKRLTLVLAAFAFALSSNPSRAAVPPSQALSFVLEQGSPLSSAAPASAPGVAAQETPQKITAYTLAPDRYQKARELSRIYFRFAIIGFLYGLVVFWLILRWKFAPKYRDWAESSSSSRLLQAMVFSPLLILTVGVLEMPTGIYLQSVSRKYGISVQGWRSWSLNWGKQELVAVIVGTIFIMILYAVIRRSPRRWWFYFWLVSLPISLFMFFLQPLVVDPLFHKFEPLVEKDPALTAALNRELIAKTEAIDSPPRVVLDMDSTEIPVYGRQEHSAYNGHFESTCYHPLLLFNRRGRLPGRQAASRQCQQRRRLGGTAAA